MPFINRFKLCLSSHKSKWEYERDMKAITDVGFSA
uniref:Uncharacterized protein n=1 Tax=Rhizophora mucronata TaxID=61149 RepID=A0A2P2LUN9_RHIMU